MDKTKTTKTFLVSDESINSYGFRVLTSGIETSAFESNPVMLFMHQRGKVFGSWVNLVKKDGKLYADPVCDTEDEDRDVKSVAGKVERGFLKAASIGLEIIEVEWNEALSCYEATKSILQEISIVDIPGNRNAVRLFANGQPLSEEQLKDKLATLSAPPANDTILSITNTPPVQMELKTIAVALGLLETATEQEVQSTVVKLAAESGYKEKFDTLTATLSAAKVKDAESLIDEAVNDKRITADMKPTYVSLFAADFDSAKAVLAKLHKPVDLTQLVAGGQTALAALTDEEASKKYDELDRSGKLIQLRSGNTAEFNRLFEAKWGRKPTA